MGRYAAGERGDGRMIQPLLALASFYPRLRRCRRGIEAEAKGLRMGRSDPGGVVMFADGRTIRRRLLDSALAAHARLMRGRVIDLGGKKVGKRGGFRPPSDGVLCWHYVNTDPATEPDFLADIARVPVGDGGYDVAICTETLEHVKDVEAAASEIHRLLRPGGLALISVPFMFPIHADPDDYHRFTESGIRSLLGRFSRVEIEPMGGFLEAVALQFDLARRRLSNRRFAHLMAKLCFVAAGIQNAVGSKLAGAGDWKEWTTGYFCKAVK
ncbi:MAG: class I SAM-dependent methyltransferase [Planctomycetota bacterium]|nr:class I SAM-dependent methyltransferase [Planctomycetota bacterium]